MRSAYNPIQVSGNSIFNIGIDEIKMNNIESILSKNYDLYVFFNRFYNMISEIFTFNLIEPSISKIPQNYIQNLLIYNGNFYIVRKNDIYDIVKCGILEKNRYDEPTKVVDEKTDEIYLKKDFSEIKLNNLNTPLISYIFFYALKMTQTMRDIDNNVFVQAQPLILTGTEEQELSLINIFEKIENKAKAVFLKKREGQRIDDNVSVLKLGGEWFGDKYIELLNFYEQKLFEIIGINFTPFEKKERLVTDEVHSNDMLLELSKNSMLNSLLNSIEKCNKHFNRKIIELDVENSKIFTENKGGERDVYNSNKKNSE